MAAEKIFENKVKSFLEKEDCWWIKYWAGAAYTKAGIPDLIICCRDKFIACEIKAPTGKPTTLQIHHLKKIDETGGYAVLLYPNQFELFQNFIHCISKGDQENADRNYKLLKSRWEHFENKS